jgi:hypothetical protein
MAVTVIGGLLTSTLLTLVLIPAVYTLMDDFTGLLARAPRVVRLLVRMPRFQPQQHVPEPMPEREPEAPRSPERDRVPVGSGAD